MTDDLRKEDFSWALERMKQGHKMARKKWSADLFVERIADNRIGRGGLGDRPVLWFPDQEDLFAEDWTMRT